MEILEKTILDSDMCWDNTLENSPEKFSVVLNSKSLDELLINRGKIPNEDPNDFKFLKEYVENLKNKEKLRSHPVYLFLRRKKYKIIWRKEYSIIFSS